MVLFLQEHSKQAIFTTKGGQCLPTNRPAPERAVTRKNVKPKCFCNHSAQGSVWCTSEHWSSCAAQPFPRGQAQLRHSWQSGNARAECSTTHRAHHVDDRGQSGLVLGVVEPCLFAHQSPQLVQVDSGTELLVSLQVVVSHTYLPEVTRVTVEQTHPSLDHIFSSA